MTDESLERLRAVNPVPDEVPAPPFEVIRATVAAVPARGRARAGRHAEPGPPRRHRLTGLGLPTAGALIALAVGVIALIGVGHGTRHAGVTPAAVAPSMPRPGAIGLPRGGMPGVVQLGGAALSSAGAGVISFEQCQPCHTTQRFADWAAVTRDGGLHWAVGRRPYLLADPQFSGGRDGWASGFSHRMGAPSVYNDDRVTHDGGLSWALAPVGAPGHEPGDVSVAGGEVWALATACARGCAARVLRGPAAASTPTSTAGQPLPTPILGGADIVAAGADTAYLRAVTGRLVRLYVTRDGGRTWQRAAAPCARAVPDTVLVADSPASLWEECPGPQGFLLARSLDGGRHWRSTPFPFGLFRIRPITAAVAWAVTDHGVVIRTTDGGGHWRAVWRGNNSATLFAQTTQRAEVAMTIGRGTFQHHALNTNLVVYRTQDGGRSWRPVVVPLPAR